MSVKKEYINILDFIKGIFFIISIYILYCFSPVIIIIYCSVIYWILETSLFFLSDDYKKDFLVVILSIFCLFIMPKFIAFGKGSCNVFKVNKEYKPLVELKKLFEKNNRVSRVEENRSFFYYFSRTLLLIYSSMFLIGLFIKVK